MKQGTFTIWKNNAIISGVHKLTLYGDTSAITRPGQFADVHIDGHFLRRPFSVCDWDKDVLVLVYRLIGQGTRDLAEKQPGEGLDILTGLGNGFDTSLSGDHPLLVAGGSGVPMMLALTKQLVREGKQVTALLGYRTAGDIFMDDDIRAAGADVIVTTEDGSFGRKGMVTDVMPELDSHTFTPAGRRPCSGQWTPWRTPPGSSALRPGWAAGTAPAWAAPARQNTAPNASARMARY